MSTSPKLGPLAAGLDLAGWTPTVEERDDQVSATTAQALHDLLDRTGMAPDTGQRLPLLWHWLAFLPRSRQADLGPDGHPTTGTFLPPTEGLVRMYAGGRTTTEGAVLVGEPLHRRSEVTEVTEKHGRSGRLLLVTVTHHVSGAHGSITEAADIVYRPAPTPPPAPPAGPEPALPAPGSAPTNEKPPPAEAAAQEWARQREITISTPLLFRFSALTYNAHRIHYDRDYTTQTEGYPGLVVHGPLQAVLLADAVDRAHHSRVLTNFSFRATAPAFDTDPLTLRLTHPDPERRVHAEAASAGRTTMTANAVLASRETR